MKRKAIALFVATMLAMSLVPMMAMPAMAATVSNPGLVPNLLIGATSTAPGRIMIEEAFAGEITTAADIIVQLPTNVTWPANTSVRITMTEGAGMAVDGAALVVGTPVAPAPGSYNASLDQITINVTTASTTKAKLLIDFFGATPGVTLSSDVAEGDVNATVKSGVAFDTTVTIGKAVKATTSSSCITTPIPNVLAGMNGQAVGQFRIEENVPGVLSVGQTITLTAPAGTSWATGPNPTMAITTVDGTGVGAVTLGGGGVAALSNADRVATWTVTAASTNRSRLTVTAATSRLNVSSSASGDLSVTVGGSDSDIKAEDVKVATVTTLGTANTCPTSPLPKITVGTTVQAAGSIRIKENAAGSLVGSGRFITLTAPANVTFNALPGVAVTSGNLALGASSLSTDNKVVTINVNTASTTKSQIDITGVVVNTNGDTAPGDLNIAIGGTAGATAGNVNVALLRLPATIAAASKPSIKLGDQGATVGDLTITENFAKAFDTGANIDICLPSGMEWYSVLPTVTVSSGNMIIGTASRIGGYYANDTLRIPVTAASVGSPATLTITGIKYNAQAGAVLGSCYAKLQNSNQMKAANANIVSSQTQATFVIGQNTYTRAGITYVMDVAPYTEGGRTYVPVRYLAYAMGITDSGIAWDAATQTATLTKGTTVVKLVIGSKNLDKNGAITTMDVAAVTKNGRTMLPARWVAEAFGANVDWNSANQTVYVTYL